MITGLALTEISIVDRPANPEAVFDCWKRAALDPPDIADKSAAGSPHPNPPPLAGEGVYGSRFKNPPPLAGEGGERSERVGADRGGHGRLRALLAELCDALDSFASDGTTDGLAALALAGGLRKAQQAEAASVAASLAKLADDIVPRLDALQRRVEDIANTPLPPLTASRGISAIAKRDDGTYSAAAPEDIVATLAQMTEEERTLTLIKAAHATPLRPTR